MTFVNSIRWRLAATVVAVFGLLGVGLTAAGPASANVNPNGTTLGSTIGNPVNLSATVPTSITLSIQADASGVAFGSIQPGSSASAPVSTVVTSNDPAGYVTSVVGTNNGTAFMAGNPTARCPENIPNIAFGTSPTTPVGTYAPSGGVTRPVQSWSTSGFLADGTLANSGAIAEYVPTPSGSTLGSSSEVAAFLDGDASAVTPSAPAWNQGMTALRCTFSGAYNAGGQNYTGHDVFGINSLPWASLTAAPQSGTPVPFTENDAEGTYTNVVGGNSTTFQLDTNLIPLDAKNGVSGTAGSATNTTDSYTDTLALSVPGNQAAGSYQAALDWVIWGN